MKKTVTIASCLAASSKPPANWYDEKSPFSVRNYGLTDAGLETAKLELKAAVDKFLETTWNQFHEDNNGYN